MATIDNLSIQVTASAESAASALDRLASSAGGAHRWRLDLRERTREQQGRDNRQCGKASRNYGAAAGKAEKRGISFLEGVEVAYRFIGRYERFKVLYNRNRHRLSLNHNLKGPALPQ